MKTLQFWNSQRFGISLLINFLGGKFPKGGVAVKKFSCCADKNELNENKINEKMIKNPTQCKNTQLIQANKMGKLIEDSEQAFLCMIRPREMHGIIEAAKKE